MSIVVTRNGFAYEKLIQIWLALNLGKEGPGLAPIRGTLSTEVGGRATMKWELKTPDSVEKPVFTMIVANQYFLKAESAADLDYHELRQNIVAMIDILISLGYVKKEEIRVTWMPKDRSNPENGKNYFLELPLFKDPSHIGILSLQLKDSVFSLEHNVNRALQLVGNLKSSLRHVAALPSLPTDDSVAFESLFKWLLGVYEGYTSFNKRTVFKYCASDGEGLKREVEILVNLFQGGCIYVEINICGKAHNGLATDLMDAFDDLVY